MKTKVCSEIEMVERARRDLDAFGELVERHRGSIIRQCYSRVNDRHHAEDLAQETFIRAYLKLDQLRDPEMFPAWLRKIAANVCGEFARSSSRQELPWETLPEAPAPQEAHGQLAEVLACLPPDTRKCVEMYYELQMSYAEIAESMGVSESSVRNRLHRAKSPV